MGCSCARKEGEKWSGGAGPAAQCAPVNRAELRRAIAVVVSLAKAYQGEHSKRGVVVELRLKPRGGRRALATGNANSGEAKRRAVVELAALLRGERRRKWGERGGRARRWALWRARRGYGGHRDVRCRPEPYAGGHGASFPCHGRARARRARGERRRELGRLWPVGRKGGARAAIGKNRFFLFLF
jgi:hypothetical protein